MKSALVKTSSVARRSSSNELCPTVTLSASVMPALKRKDAPKHGISSTDLKTKKLKIEPKFVKTLPKQVPTTKPEEESDELEESDTTEDDAFGGFSENGNPGNSDTEKDDTDEDSTVQPANGVTKTPKPTASTNGVSNCMY